MAKFGFNQRDRIGLGPVQDEFDELYARLQQSPAGDGVLEVEHGGTGLSSWTQGDLISFSDSTTMVPIAAVAKGQVMISQGVSTEPIWSPYIDLSQTSPGAPTSGMARLYNATLGGHEFITYQDDEGHEIILARDSFIVCRNNTGVQIDAGKAVYISGSNGSWPEISLAQADDLATLPALGIVYEDIADAGFGRVMIWGRLTGLNTNSWNAGDPLYVSAGSAGELTNVEPSSPNYSQRVGIVVKKGPGSSGIIIVTHSDVEAQTAASSGGFEPVTDGDLAQPELVFAAGDVIMVEML